MLRRTFFGLLGVFPFCYLTFKEPPKADVFPADEKLEKEVRDNVHRAILGFADTMREALWFEPEESVAVWFVQDETSDSKITKLLADHIMNEVFQIPK